jgi:hypothetical protein
VIDVIGVTHSKNVLSVRQSLHVFSIFQMEERNFQTKCIGLDSNSISTHLANSLNSQDVQKCNKRYAQKMLKMGPIKITLIKRNFLFKCHNLFVLQNFRCYGLNHQEKGQGEKFFTNWTYRSHKDLPAPPFLEKQGEKVLKILKHSSLAQCAHIDYEIEWMNFLWEERSPVGDSIRAPIEAKTDFEKKNGAVCEGFDFFEHRNDDKDLAEFDFWS